MQHKHGGGGGGSWSEPQKAWPGEIPGGREEKPLRGSDPPAAATFPLGESPRLGKSGRRREALRTEAWPPCPPAGHPSWGRAAEMR